MQFLPVVNTFSLALLLSVHTMAHSWQTRTWGMLIVRSCMLVGVCRVRFLMRRPLNTLDKRRFRLMMSWRLLALPASCVSPLRLYASLCRTYERRFSLVSASCLSLRPPAAMSDGWFPPVHTFSSVSLCHVYFEYHDHAFLLLARWRRLPWAWVFLLSNTVLFNAAKETGSEQQLESDRNVYSHVPSSAKDHHRRLQSPMSALLLTSIA